MPLSDEQLKVISLISCKRNIFITGPGGTGKSYLINHIVKLFEDRYRVKVCAMTGVAAELLNCGASTIHSWSGIGKAGSDIDKIVNKVLRNKQSKNNWKNTDILIIDEVSMMSVKFLKMLEYISRKIRKDERLFGGLQVVFSGDFHQLPPIGDKDTHPSHESHKFCFECSLWNQLFPRDNVIELTKFFRQVDPTFTKLLMQVRKGKISRNTNDIFKSRLIKNDKIATIIYPRKKKVKDENDKHMEELTGEIYTYTSQIVKKEEFYLQTDLPESYVNHELRCIKNNMNVDESIQLKIGAHVMCIANIDMTSSSQIVNGSQGIVINIDEGIPVVKFKNGIIRKMEYHHWMSEDIPGLGIRQIPLILAWSITIHKAQGVTLDEAIIDAGQNNFEYGQVYVALSRVKRLEGLYLKDFNPYSIKTNPLVTDYYKSLG